MMKRSAKEWAIRLLPLGFIAGLVVALTGDGWRDAAAWLALGAPVCAVGWAMKTRRR